MRVTVTRDGGTSPPPPSHRGNPTPMVTNMQKHRPLVLIAISALCACSLAGQPSGESERTSQTSEAVTPASGSKPWLVIKCMASDNTSEPAHMDYNAMFSAGGGGVVDYYNNQSYGFADLSGTVVAPQWINSGFTQQQINGNGSEKNIEQCIDLGLDVYGYNANNFYGFIALYNVVAYAVGGISVNIVGRSGPITNAVLADLWTSPRIFAHEMGHGFTLGHSYGDQSGPYGDSYDIMSAANVLSFETSSCSAAWCGSGCSNDGCPASCSGVTANDCWAGPGLNIWNRVQLGWGAFNGIPFAAITASTPVNSTVSLVPRNHPEMWNPSSGLFMGYLIVPNANGLYGYTIEFITADGWERGITWPGGPAAPVMVIHKVYAGNSTPYLVQESGGVQSDFSHPYTDSTGIKIALRSIQGSPPSATVVISY
jgi:hypothetical protein